MTTENLEEEPEKIVKSFYNYLKREKGLSEETAPGHAHQISFFALHYLTGYEGKSLLEVTSTDIGDYLGNWYIRKIWGSGGSDARSILIAFKKFYKFLHERGNVEEEQLRDILAECKNPQRYIRRFESYLELDPESETWDEDFRNWFINDFQTFLTYISAHNGMKLTAANSFIVRKHVFTLNKIMSNPEELKSTANEPDSRTIHLFYNISKTLNVFVVSEKNTLEV
jgi:hypothetical protein